MNEAEYVVSSPRAEAWCAKCCSLAVQRGKERAEIETEIRTLNARYLAGHIDRVPADRQPWVVSTVLNLLA